MELTETHLDMLEATYVTNELSILPSNDDEEPTLRELVEFGLMEVDEDDQEIYSFSLTDAGIAEAEGERD